MKRRDQKRVGDVESLGTESEFAPRQHRVKVFDLRPRGVPDVPVFEQCSYSRCHTPSSWHLHRSCFEFIYCIGGRCRYESDGRDFLMSSGTMFFSRPGEPHRQLDCPKGFSTYCLHFRPTTGAVSQWFRRQFESLPRCFRCRRSPTARFARITALVESPREDMAFQIRLQAEVRLLLLELLEATPIRADGRAEGLFGEIARRIETQPEHDYRLDDLVAESGMCKASFISAFKAELGYSPYSYVLFCRTDLAKRLLQEGFSVKEVAARLGFSSAQRLIRTFKNFVGVPPAKWQVRAGVAQPRKA